MENKYSVVDVEDGDDDDIGTSESSNHVDFAASSKRPHSYDDSGSRDSDDTISSEERYYHL